MGIISLRNKDCLNEVEKSLTRWNLFFLNLFASPFLRRTGGGCSGCLPLNPASQLMWLLEFYTFPLYSASMAAQPTPRQTKHSTDEFKLDWAHLHAPTELIQVHSMINTRVFHSITLGNKLTAHLSLPVIFCIYRRKHFRFERTFLFMTNEISILLWWLSGTIVLFNFRYK